MDPDATWASANDSDLLLIDQLAHTIDLWKWITDGGFPPKGVTRRQVYLRMTSLSARFNA